MTTEVRNIYRARLRMRPDLICSEQRIGSQEAWVVKDPVSLRYFTLTPQEFAILNWLDGENSLQDICREFAAAFPPQRITPAHLQSFFANLYENGLIIAEAPDQGSILLENRERQQRRERLQTWLNWLAIRLPIFDPDRLLTWLEPKVSWLFSRAYLFAWVIFAMFALGFAAYHASEFRAQLPELKELLSPHNLLWMAVAFAAAKVLHEFGHALACKHFGGECHEMGLMLLMFVPCMYCNVTDSWMLENRWRRIAVSAAGMFVEFQLSALAVFVWWFSEPGVIHAIALNTMVVCTVGTLFFNGNPLLRYDGYFILLDLLGIPNLWQESRSALKSTLAKWFLRPEFVPPTDAQERRRTLIAYAALSIVYRIFVMIAILLFLQRVLIPKGLGVFIPVVLATFVVSAAVYWFISLRHFWSRPMAWRQFRSGRVLYAIVAVLTAGCLLFAIPLPCRISAPVLLQPVAAQRVYVSTPGALTRCIAPGESVATNQEIAHLDDVKLHRDVVRLTGELSVARSRVRKSAGTAERRARGRGSTRSRKADGHRHRAPTRATTEGRESTHTHGADRRFGDGAAGSASAFGWLPELAALVGHAVASQEQTMLLGARDARLPGGRSGIARGRAIYRRKRRAIRAAGPSRANEICRCARCRTFGQDRRDREAKHSQRAARIGRRSGVA